MISSKELAKLLDTKFQGPFGFRFGLDGLIGLIPGIGDIITTIMAFGIVFNAFMRDVKLSVITRMMINILIDNIISKIPLIGFLADFGFKSNQKNLQLLNEFQVQPQKTAKKSLWFIVMIVITLLIMISLSIYLSYLLISTLLQGISA
ncbi:MAG: hypothetical protein CME62_06465 [Halobacteriovoraceae bacterium]|nr:hypothetical protein [Halobacteriovoraceae bacterium]|tara:strand:- start:10715 stop:11158 length:444 start_codon:yes stop_codon:yes gene_type:complete